MTNESISDADLAVLRAEIDRAKGEGLRGYSLTISFLARLVEEFECLRNRNQSPEVELAEHPADDDDEIGKHWLDENSHWKNDDGWWFGVQVSDDREAVIGVEFQHIDYQSGPKFCAVARSGDLLKVLKTRGDSRRLLAACGIAVNGFATEETGTDAAK